MLYDSHNLMVMVSLMQITPGPECFTVVLIWNILDNLQKHKPFFKVCQLVCDVAGTDNTLLFHRSLNSAVWIPGNIARVIL